MNKISLQPFPPEQDCKASSPALAERGSRRQWMMARARQQLTAKKVTPVGVFRNHFPMTIKLPIILFEAAIKSLRLFKHGVRNAMDVRLKPMDLYFPSLPSRLDGYRILHLTDFHLDLLPGLASQVAAAIDGVSCDLCVMTGDYQYDDSLPVEKTLGPLREIITAIDSRDGIFATLGNHDHHRMIHALERIEVQTLVNETVFLERDGANFHLTGLDDVNRYYTPMAAEALTRHKDSFGIALVHSPEMAEEAARQGYSLYLCGHTHGGQVCLPGGYPVFTLLNRNHQYKSGLWQCLAMTGYTSPGAGVSAVPVRFFSRGEATLITLRQGDGNQTA